MRSISPPRFGISNGWAIEHVPSNSAGYDINEIIVSTLARVRIFSNVYSYMTGDHKSIRGHHIYFINNF